MYIYNTIYNYYIHFSSIPLLIKADSNKFGLLSTHTLPTIIYKTGKEDLEQPPRTPSILLSRLSRVTFYLPKTRHDTHHLASRHEALCLVSLQPSPHEAPSIPLRGKSGERLTRKGERGTLFLANSHCVSAICYICNE